MKRRRIGLLGGTFNPPHEGHRHLSRTAKRLLNLDEVWWLISPGNPLKANPPPPFAERWKLCSEHVRDERFIRLSDFEAKEKTRYTIDTVIRLQRRYPGFDFVWLCGSDIAEEIQRWKQWQRLLRLIPFFCAARPPEPRIVKGNAIRMGQTPPQRFLSRTAPLPLRAPLWCWALEMPRNFESSTALRSKEN